MRVFANQLSVRFVVLCLFSVPMAGIPGSAQEKAPQVWHPKQQSVFGGIIQATSDGDPTLHFQGKSGWDLDARLVLYLGRPAFALPASVWHTFGSIHYSDGTLLISKDFVVYAVKSGDKVLSSDAFEFSRNQVELTFSYGSTFNSLQFHMKSPSRKVSGDLTICDSKQKTSLHFLQSLVGNFDAVLNQFEDAAGLSNLEAQLSPTARFQHDSDAEIAANVQQVKDREAAEKAAKGGGNGWAAATAILTGASQAVANRSSNPIQATTNQQVAAIQAIADAKAAQASYAAQAAQARVATQQAAAQQTQMAASGKQRQSLATSSNSSASSASSGAETPEEPQPVQAMSQPETVLQLPPGCLRVSVKLFYDNQPDSGMYYGVNNCGVSIHVDIAMTSGYAGATGLPPGSGGFLGASANMGAYKVWYCPVPYWPSDPNNHPENGPTYSADLNSVMCRDPSNPGQIYGNAAGSTQ